MHRLYRRLSEDGFEPWLDEENLLPGEEWEKEIPKAVRDSDVVIVCLSPASIDKAGYVQKEIKFALDIAEQQPEGTIFLIPLKLEECDVPGRLGRWQWVNYFADNGYRQLFRALQRRADKLGITIRIPPALADDVHDTAHQIVTVLFSDIHGFTRQMEGISPDNIIRVLNTYFSAMNECVYNHRGKVVAYLGDGLVAIFGAGSPTPGDACNAVASAVAMQQRLPHINNELRSTGFGAISIGIGIHTGWAIIGKIGSQQFSSYTAIGDTVNLAARLSAKAKSDEILLSAATAAAAQESRYQFLSRGDIIIKGVIRPMPIFAVNWQPVE